MIPQMTWTVFLLGPALPGPCILQIALAQLLASTGNFVTCLVPKLMDTIRYLVAQFCRQHILNV